MAAPNRRELVIGGLAQDAVISRSSRLATGLLVVLADENYVLEARRTFRALDNVMFVPFDGEHIPWQDGFFHAVSDLRGASAASLAEEIDRVTAPSEDGAYRA